LAIAVSYGKLIPEQFLQNCNYGGLNVHPSLLPKYSGSSPIQYALMNDDSFTGVTIQTLHPTKFDHGDIVLQSPEIPIQDDDDFCLLRDKLGAIGGDLLNEVMAKELYLNYPKTQPNYLYSLAPKISPQRSQIDWNNHTPRQIKRLADALGPLHTYKFVDIKKKKVAIKENQKVLLSDIQIDQTPSDLNRAGDFKLENGRLYIMANGGCISVGSLKFQCCGQENPTDFVRLLKKRSGDTPDTFVFYTAK
jgi:methionyl-tRNA formyltransferase